MRAALSLLLVALPGGCVAEDLPPAWLIAADVLDETGAPDERGKLRVLALLAEPPEAAPAEQVALRALIVTHPQHGQVVTRDGREERTPWVRGLSALWLLCRTVAGEAATAPCALGTGPGLPEGTSLLGTEPEAVLTIPPAAPQGAVFVVTLIAADEAHEGGAMGCLAEAQRNGGVAPRRNRCVIALKRIRVASRGVRNHNPAIAGLTLREGERDLPLDGGWPEFALRNEGGETAPLALTLTRGADSVESYADEREPDKTLEEVLSVSYFVTAGRLEAGRGGFVDLACDPPCPMTLTSQVGWTPPTVHEAARSAPSGVVYFFAVLRDDRGGAAVRAGAARAR